MLGHALKQLEINKGIGHAAVAPLHDRAVGPRAHNEVNGFLIKHAVALEPQVVYDLLRECRQFLIGQAGLLESSNGVQPSHPFVDKDILPQDVYFYAGVLGDFAHDFGLGAAGLPQLEPLWRHIHGKGLLQHYFQVARAIAVGAQFLHQGEFLEGAVEFGPQHVLDDFCFQRHILPHAAPLDDHVERFALPTGFVVTL